MVTDRCSTAGLLCALSNEYSGQPSFVLVSDTLVHGSLLSSGHFV